MWQLIINGPGYFDTAYDLPEGVTTFGRAEENDIVLSGELVSRRHVRFMVTPDQLAVEDLGSRNGTKLNGEAFTGMRMVAAGDVITIGENSLALRRPSQPEQAATEVLDLTGGQVRRADEEVGFAPQVIVKRNVNRSVLLRALDNFGPFVPAPFDLDPQATREPEPQPPTRRAMTPPTARPGLTVPPLSYESLALLFKVAESLARALTLNEFLTDAVDRVLARVGANTMVVLLRQASGALAPVVVRHREELSQGEVPVSDAIISESLRSGSAIAVAVQEDPRFAQRESVLLYRADQVLCIPVGRAPPFPGVLYLNRASTERESLDSLLDVLTAVANLVAVAVERFRSQSTPVENLRRALERFHPPAVVERQLEAAASSTAGALLEPRQATVVRAELSGWDTALSRVPPARAAELLQAFHRRMTPLVFSFQGSVLGAAPHCVTGVFGVTEPHPDDAIRAVRAAIAMREEWSKVVAAQPGADGLALTVGVHTGKVLAGLVGADARVELAVVGEPVSVAGWIGETAGPGQILISGRTLASIGARFDVTPLGERAVHPGAGKLAVFEVLAEDVSDQTEPGVG